ncbi:hypothetical protein EH32_05385 [Erythrobacter litoralis]|uniref:Spore protein n=2 Tax=Erythrobacter litoralis TaxID=39960 RepID=A0A074NL88_9SPHN|nr:hypothetical protein EH32_05385 [Erythrobacter litoralis]
MKKETKTMTEEEIRAIVRDELEAECLKVGGLYDSTRNTAFKVVQGATDLIAKQMLAMFEGSKRGPN